MNITINRENHSALRYTKLCKNNHSNNVTSRFCKKCASPFSEAMSFLLGNEAEQNSSSETDFISLKHHVPVRSFPLDGDNILLKMRTGGVYRYQYSQNVLYDYTTGDLVKIFGTTPDIIYTDYYNTVVRTQDQSLLKISNAAMIHNTIYDQLERCQHRHIWPIEPQLENGTFNIFLTSEAPVLQNSTSGALKELLAEKEIGVFEHPIHKINHKKNRYFILSENRLYYTEPSGKDFHPLQHNRKITDFLLIKDYLVFLDETQKVYRVDPKTLLKTKKPNIVAIDKHNVLAINRFYGYSQDLLVVTKATSIDLINCYTRRPKYTIRTNMNSPASVVTSGDFLISSSLFRETGYYTIQVFHIGGDKPALIKKINTLPGLSKITEVIEMKPYLFTLFLLVKGHKEGAYYLGRFEI